MTVIVVVVVVVVIVVVYIEVVGTHQLLDVYWRRHYYYLYT